MNSDQAVERIIDEQLHLIAQKHPQAEANVGWGQIVTDSYVRVETKVYVDPCEILVSEVKLPNGSITNEWRPYK